MKKMFLCLLLLTVSKLMFAGYTYSDSYVVLNVGRGDLGSSSVMEYEIELRAWYAAPHGDSAYALIRRIKGSLQPGEKCKKIRLCVGIMPTRVIFNASNCITYYKFDDFAFLSGLIETDPPDDGTMHMICQRHASLTGYATAQQGFKIVKEFNCVSDGVGSIDFESSSFAKMAMKITCGGLSKTIRSQEPDIADCSGRVPFFDKGDDLGGLILKDLNGIPILDDKNLIPIPSPAPDPSVEYNGGSSISYYAIQKAFKDLNVFGKPLIVDLYYDTSYGLIHKQTFNPIFFIPAPSFTVDQVQPTCIGRDDAAIQLKDFPSMGTLKGVVTVNLYSLSSKGQSKLQKKFKNTDSYFNEGVTLQFGLNELPDRITNSVIEDKAQVNAKPDLSEKLPATTKDPFTLTSGKYYVYVTLDIEGTADRFCPFEYEFTINEPPNIEITEIDIGEGVESQNGSGKSYHITTPTGTASGTITISGRNKATFSSNISGVTISNPVKVSGTTNTYSYSITGLKSGTNSICVTDKNGCTSNSFSKNVTKVPTLTKIAESSLVNVKCHGEETGSVNFTITGGFGPYRVTLSAPGHTNEIIKNHNNVIGSFDGLSGATYTITVKDQAMGNIDGSEKKTDPFTIKEATEDLSYSKPTFNQIVCHDDKGSFSLKAKGGMQPYDYYYDELKYEDKDTDYIFKKEYLAAGTYQCKIVDALGCSTGNIPIIINEEPDPITISDLTLIDQPTADGRKYHTKTIGGLARAELTITGRSDNDYDIVSPNGASLSYITPDNSFTLSGLIAGANQKFQVKDGTCFSNKFTVPTINEPNVLSVSVVDTDITHVACHGDDTGSVNFTIAGGFGPYTVELLSGTTPKQTKGKFKKMNRIFTGISAGTYTIKVTDDESGTSVSTTPFSIEQPSKPLAFDLEKIKEENPHCYGDSNGLIELAAKGGTSPYKYSIAGSDLSADGKKRTDLADGTHKCIIKDAKGCLISKPIQLSQPNALSLEKVTQTNASCTTAKNGSIIYNLLGGHDSDATELTVTLTGQMNRIVSSTTRNIKIEGLEPGDYDVSVTNKADCGPVTTEFTIEALQGAEKLFKITSTEAKPASCKMIADGKLKINLSNGLLPLAETYRLKLNDIAGGDYKPGTFLSDLSVGTYKVELTDEHNCPAVKEDIKIEIDLNHLKLADPIKNMPTCDGFTDGEIHLQGVNGKLLIPINGYQYSVDDKNYSRENIFRNLKATTYTAYVKDDAGCVVEREVTLQAPDPIVVSTPVLKSIDAVNDEFYHTNKIGGLAKAELRITGRLDDKYDVVSPDNATLTSMTNHSFTLDLPKTSEKKYFRVKQGVCLSNKKMLPEIIEPETLAVSINQNGITHVTCRGDKTGAVKFTITGGFGLYKVSLMEGENVVKNISKLQELKGEFTGLTGGNYTIKVEDNAVDDPTIYVSISAFTIKEAEVALTNTSPEINQIVCHGDKASFSYKAIGGMQPYDYYYEGDLVSEDKFSDFTFEKSELEGDKTYTCKVVDALGCSSDNIPVKIDTQPDKIIISDLVLDTKHATNGQYYHTNKIGGLAKAELRITGRLDDKYDVVSPIGASLTSESNHSFTLDLFKKFENKYFQVKQGVCLSNKKMLPEIIEPETLAVSINQKDITHVTCRGDKVGAVKFTITGGFGPYKVSLIKAGILESEQELAALDGIFDKLSGGIYEIKVEDLAVGDPMKCFTTPAFTIKEAEAALTNTSPEINQIVCHGDKASFSFKAKGGMQPYVYYYEGKLVDKDKYSDFVFERSELDGDKIYTCKVVDALGCSSGNIPVEIDLQPDKIIISDLVLKTKDAINGLAYHTNKISGLSTAELKITGRTNDKYDIFSPIGASLTSESNHFFTLDLFKKFENKNFQVKQGECYSNIKLIPEIIEPEILAVLESNIINVNCFDDKTGAVNFTITGGFGPYDIKLLKKESSTDKFIACQSKPDYQSMSGSFADLYFGSYKIQVTDKASSTVQTTKLFHIEQPAAPLAFDLDNIKQKNPNCFGIADGIIELAAKGGTKPYKYSISGQALSTDGNIRTDLLDGTHICIIEDDKGCTTIPSKKIVLNHPDLLSLTAKTNPASCAEASNGSVNLSLAGGHDADATDLKVGLSLVKNFNNIVIFNDKSYTGRNFTIKDLEPGDYVVSVTNQQECMAAQKDFTIGILAEVDQFQITLLEKKPAACDKVKNGELNINVEKGKSFSDGTYLMTSDLSSQEKYQPGSYILNLDGTLKYKVKLTDANNCSAIQDNISIGIDVNRLRMETSIIQSTCDVAKNGEIHVKCQGGKTIDHSQTLLYRYSIDGSDFTEGPFKPDYSFKKRLKGTYQIRVMDDAGCVVTRNAKVTARNNPIGFSLTPFPESCIAANNGRIEITNIENRDKLNLVYRLDGDERSPLDVAPKKKEFKALDSGDHIVHISDKNGCFLIKNTKIPNLHHSPVASFQVLDSLACSSSSDGMLNFAVNTPGYTSNLTYGLYDSQDEKQSGLLAQNLLFSKLNHQNYTFVLTDDDHCEHRLLVNVPVKKDVVRIVTNQWTPSSCVRAKNGSIEVKALGGKPSDKGYFYGLLPVLPEGQSEIYVQSTRSAQARFDNLTVGSQYVIVIEDGSQCMLRSDKNKVGVVIDSLKIADVNPTNPLCFETATGEISPIIINNKVNLNYTYGIGKKNAEGEYEALPESQFNNEKLIYTDLEDGTYKISVEDSEKCLAQFDEIVLKNPAKADLVESSFNYIRKKGDKEGEFEFTFSGVNKNFDYKLRHNASGEDIKKGNLSYSEPALEMIQKLGQLAAGNYIFSLTDTDACLDFDGSDTYVEPFEIKEPAHALSYSNEFITDASCKSFSDGAIRISGFGGWGDYSYSLNGTDWQKTGVYTDLKAGDYAIHIKDSTEVSFLHPFSISEPDTLNVFIDKIIDATCPNYANGKISATSINGIPFDKGLNYWLKNIDDPSLVLGDKYSDSSYDFNELPKGNYELFVVDSHSCQASKPFSISEPDTAKIQLTHNYIKAKGDASGEIALKISKGNGVFDYKCFLNQESDPFVEGQTNSDIDLHSLVAGSYKIKMRDIEACVYEDDEWMERIIEIREPSEALSFTVEKDTVVSCNGLSDASIKLKAVGGWGDYSYSFDGDELGNDTEINMLPAGLYSVQISDSTGVMWTRNVTVIEPEILKAEYLSHKDVNCNGESNGEIALKIEGGNVGYSLSSDDETWTEGSVLKQLQKGTYNLSVKDAKGCRVQLAPIEVNQPDELKLLSSDVIKSLCSNNEGSISTEFVGGVGDYAYEWKKDTLIDDKQVWLNLTNRNSSNIDNLFSSIYRLKLVDAQGCDLNVDFALGDITDLAIEKIEVKDVSCWGDSNGQALAKVIKGNEPYVYTWGPNVSGQDENSAWDMPAGIYDLLVRDDKGCAASSKFTVGTPDPLSYKIQDLTQPLCNGGEQGQISLSGTGGTPNYQYLWSNGSSESAISDLNPGVYTLKLSDSHSCESNFTFDLEYQRQLKPFIGNDTLICDYNSLLVDGGDYAQYRWTSNFDVDFSSGKAKLELTEPGNYYLEVEDDDSCLGFDTLKLDVSYLKIEDLKIKDVSCHALANGSAQIEITAQDWEHTVRWPDASSDLSWTNLSGGNYKVEVEDVHACRDSREFSIFEPDTLDIEIEAFTHPICSDVTNGMIHINAKGGNGDYSYIWTDGNNNNKREGLIEGIYSLRISDKKDCAISKEFELNYQKSVQKDLGMDFLGNDTLICHYNSLTLDGREYAKHYWTSDAGFVSNSRTVELTDPANYYLKVEDDDKCFAYDTLNLNVSYLKIEALQTSDVTCHALANGRAQIELTPQNWEHTVRWPDASSDLTWRNLSGGNYKVEVEDIYACQDSREFTIFEPDTLDIDIEALTHPICSDVTNGMIDINAKGGNGGYSYLWTDGNTNNKREGLIENIYSLRISDKKDCAISKEFELNYQKSVQKDLGMDFLGNDTLICHYNSLTLDGLEYAKHYWTSDAGFASNSRTVELTDPANYYLKIEDEDKCFAYDTLKLDVSFLTIENLITTDVTCHALANGKAQIEISPKDWEHTVRWPDASSDLTWKNLSGGNYRVEVEDAYACMDSREFSIFEPDTLDIEIEEMIHPICSDVPNGLIQIKAKGGNGNYAYSWADGNKSNKLIGLDVGTYYAHITDKKNCAISKEFNLKYQKLVQQDLGPNFLGNDTLICHYKSLLLDGGDFAKLSWTSDAGFISNERKVELTKPANYYLKIEDGDKCLAYDTLKLDVSYLKIEDLTVTDVTCHALANGHAEIEITPQDWKHTVRWPDGSSDLTWKNLSGGNYKVEVEDIYACQDSREFTIFEPDTLDIDRITFNQPICSDVPNGLIHIRAKGGNGDYSYLWANGTVNNRLTYLPEASYSVRISDKKDCTITKDFKLNYQKSVQNDLGLDFLGRDTLICHYNSLTLDGRDYANHYWKSDNGFVANTRMVELTDPSNYYLKIEDEDKCFAYDTLKLDVSYLQIEHLQTTDVTCHALANGNAEISVMPADWKHTVRWPDASSDLTWKQLSGGDYKVVVEDAYACQDSRNFSIFEPDTLDLEIENLTHPICSDVTNGLIQIKAKGGNGNYSYLWTDGNKNTTRDALSEGTYSLSISDKKDCTITKDYELNYQKSIQNDLGLDFLGRDTLICHYNSLTLDGRDYANHYWTSDAGFASSNRTIELTEPATYYLKIEDEDKCLAFDTLHMDVSYLQIEDLQTTDVTCHALANGNAEISVMPADWAHTILWSDGSTKPKWNNLRGGSYQVQVKDKYNCQDTKAFLINEPDTLNLEIENFFHPLCNGVPDGFIRVKAFGGNGDYSYLWEHGADKKRLSRLPEGQYKLHISDKLGCEISHDFTLANQRSIYPDLGDDLLVCTNNYVNLYPGEFTEYKWTFDNFVKGTDSEFFAWDAGEYTVEVKDKDGCTASDQIKLTEKPSDLAPLLLSASSVALGDTLMVMEVSQPKPDNLTWEFTGAHKITEQGDFYCKLVFSEEGMFEIKLSAQLDGCIGQTQQAILVLPEQTTDENGSENSSEPDTHFSKLSVYPNPTHGPFEAEVKLTEVADVTFYLVNIQSGKIIEKRSRKGLKVYRESYNLTQDGVYCIFAESQGKRKIFKIVVI